MKRLLNLIKTSWIKDEMERAVKTIPSYFYTIPASSSGKYHPELSLGEGGLTRHTMIATQIGYEMAGLEQYGLSQEDRDFIVCALILHDTRKQGDDPAGHTVFEHPLLASQAIQEVTIPDFYNNVCPLIESHMGQWNTSKYAEGSELPKPISVRQQIVHTADYLASRRWIGADFDKILGGI